MASIEGVCESKIVMSLFTGLSSMFHSASIHSLEDIVTTVGTIGGTFCVDNIIEIRIVSKSLEIFERKLETQHL
jgi:hypothetical protein